MNANQCSQLLQEAIKLHRAGRIGEAEQQYRQLLAWYPNHSLTLHMLGMLLGQTGRSQAAIDIMRRVVRLEPAEAAAHNNLGIVLKDCGQVDESLFHFAKAIELDPKDPGAYRNMGNAYMEQGRHDQAEQCLRQAVALAPDAAEIHSNLLYVLHFQGKYDAPMLLQEHQQWAQRHERPLMDLWQLHDNDPDPKRRLKIGYVSADFCNHPVGRFLLPLFAHHDRRLFEIYCYSHLSKLPDATSQRLESHGDHWQNITGLSPRQLADQIRKDRIDILVDLAQHSGENRLLAFAHKPAPLQITWLGYPGTTGLAAMDYRFTDPYLDPPGQGDENYRERSLRLPHCFWCYPVEISLPVNPLPAAQAGYVTFGCMNRFNKVTRSTLELWRQILHRVPRSRLLIHSKIGDHLDDVRRDFTGDSIAPRRLEFVERKPLLEYLEQFHRIDISLDPFPHGGGTVTCDSLWMGVPVVTLSGQTAVGRGGASLLSNVGLPQLIAHSLQQYVEITIALAQNLASLAELRASLRSQMMASPLVDGQRFAADIEAAYRQIWKHWCQRGQPAEGR